MRVIATSVAASILVGALPAFAEFPHTLFNPRYCFATVAFKVTGLKGPDKGKVLRTKPLSVKKVWESSGLTSMSFPPGNLVKVEATWSVRNTRYASSGNSENQCPGDGGIRWTIGGRQMARSYSRDSQFTRTVSFNHFLGTRGPNAIQPRTGSILLTAETSWNTGNNSLSRTLKIVNSISARSLAPIGDTPGG